MSHECPHARFSPFFFLFIRTTDNNTVAAVRKRFAGGRADLPERERESEMKITFKRARAPERFHFRRNPYDRSAPVDVAENS